MSAEPSSAPTARPASETPEHVDVLIVGAGISGIGAGAHLGERCPDHRYLILEGRERLGGTWDLFRYPGIRSDSDMYTLGYGFHPWTKERSIADGASILKYLRSTAARYGVDQHIRYQHRVTRASWSSDDAQWTVEAVDDARGHTVRLTCNFLFMCAGYYDTEEGYTPEFAGVERFGGRIVHPQGWTDDVDYADKRVIVIGSGATAVTLVPSLAERAAHVTMLQRSPSYVMSLPLNDRIARTLRRFLPGSLAFRLIRAKQVALGQLLYTLCRRFPERMKAMLIKGAREQLGPDYDVDTHFTPSYRPWDQRLCFVPDGDLFATIQAGRASVVTDHIETFTETGIQLRSGRSLEADLIVTATGLKLRFLGGITVEVDGTAIDLAKCMAYKAMMLSDVPNLALAFGYTNASWTLKADLTSEYVCRLLNHMRRHGYRRCVPRLNDPTVERTPFAPLSSSYIQRAKAMLPQQGSKTPWKLRQSYPLDALALRLGSIQDSAMHMD